MNRYDINEILDLSDALTLILNLDGTIYYANKKVLETLECSEDDLLGKDWIDKFIPSSSKPAYLEALSKIKNKDFREFKNIEGFVKTKKGKIKIINWHVSLINEKSTSISPEEEKIISVGIDITEKTKLLEKYKKIIKLNNIAKEFSFHLLRTEDEKDLMQKLCDIIYKYEFAKYIWIGQAINDDEKSVIPIISKGFDIKELEKFNFSWADDKNKITDGGNAIKRKKAVIFRNIPDSKIDYWKETAKKYGFKSSLALPIIINNKVFGSIHMYSENLNSFDETEVEYLEKMIIDFELTAEKIRSQKSSQKNSEKVIKKEREYKSLITQMNQAFALHEVVLNDKGEVVDYIFLDVNEKFEEYTGLKREDLIGKTVLEVLPQTEKYWIDKYGKVAMTGKPTIFENYSESFGEYFLVSSYSPQHKRFVTVFTDVTFKHIAEDQLRKSEKKFRRYIEKAPIGIVVTDSEGNHLETNPTFCSMIGYSSEELSKIKAAELIYEEDRKESEKIISALNNQGNATEILRFHTKNEEIKYINIKAVKIEKEKILAFMTDITKKMQDERALVNLKTATENSIDGIAILDKNQRYIFLNEAHAKIYGYDSYKELLGKSWETLYREKELQDFENRIMPEFERNGFWKGESLGKKKDGSLFPQEISLTALKAGGLICIVRDISEKNKILNDLKESFANAKMNYELFIETLVKVVELRDPYTSGHQERVAQLSSAIANKLNLSESQIEAIRVAALLHDIGKIYIPSEILNKSTKLTRLEFEMIKEHSQNGYELLKGLRFELPVADYILQHHERNDGSGYPNGLKEDKIYFGSKIIAVADVVEAISSHRPYRPALGIEAAFEEIKKNSGILYNKEIVEACLELFNNGFEFMSKW